MPRVATADLLDDYRAGRSLHQIAVARAMSVTAVRMRLHHVGEPLRPPRRPRRAWGEMLEAIAEMKEAPCNPQ